MIVKGKISKSRLEALGYFADKLLTKQLSKYIIVKVVLRKRMNYLGLTLVEDYNKSGKPREFVLEVYKNQEEIEIIKTLAHEMVHVRQYARGELNEEATLWQGRSMARDLEYNEQPWEIEAHDLTEILYENYVNDYPNKI